MSNTGAKWKNRSEIILILSVNSKPVDFMRERAKKSDCPVGATSATLVARVT
jgi:hypothetical protein